MNYRLTRHAEEELRRRQIPRDFLDEILSAPQQIISTLQGRKVYQSQMKLGKGKIFLVRVVVDDQAKPVTVITLYRTTKIDKYWRVESESDL